MGRPKASLRWGAESFVAASLRPLHEAKCAPLVVVSGQHATETEALLPADLSVRRLRNPEPHRGQLASLKLALRALADTGGLRGAMVSLIDHPGVRAETVERLCERARPDRITVPRFETRRGHPVFFGSALFPELLATPDELGARSVVRRDGSRVDVVDVDDPAVVRDLDTPADLRDAGGT